MAAALEKEDLRRLLPRPPLVGFPASSECHHLAQICHLHLLALSMSTQCTVPLTPSQYPRPEVNGGGFCNFEGHPTPSPADATRVVWRRHNLAAKPLLHRRNWAPMRLR